jgi:hypothetical protein
LCVLLITLLAASTTGLLPTTLFAQNQSGITSPANGDSVSGDVIITGTAVIEPFLRYELYYKLEPNGDDAYIYFDGGTSQVINGQLGIWRTASLAPGSYSIRLRVVKADGNYGEFIVANLNLNLSATQEEPTATATSSEPTPTPIPTATFTPAPQPTPIVGQVTQPEFPGQAPTPSPILAPTSAVNSGESITGTGENGASAITFEESANAVGSTISGESSSVTRQLGEAVALDRLRQYFVTGMQFSAMLILGIVALMAGKRIFAWVWTQYR